MSTDCAVVKYSPKAILETSIGYEFGLRFRFVQVIGKNEKKDAKIVKSGETNIFFALFDKEDVDFEIAIENNSFRNIKWTVTVGNEKFEYIIPSSIQSSIKALKSNGQHLHFLSQNTEDGKLLVTMSAQRDGVTYDEAAISCSRITFDLALENTIEDTASCHIRPDTHDEGWMIVQIKSLTGSTLQLKVHPHDVVETVKYLIYKETGQLLDQQRLIYCGRQMEDGRTLQDYKVEAETVIHLVQRLRGGGSHEDPVISVADSTSTASASCEDNGTRGVVCFGEKTQQSFGAYNETFINSKTHTAEGFTVELRTKPRYSLLP